MINKRRFVYPVDTDQFQDIREQGKVYVDKTDLIYDLVNVKMYQYVCFKHYRKFSPVLCGKTLSGNGDLIDIETRKNMHKCDVKTIKSGCKSYAFAV